MNYLLYPSDFVEQTTPVYLAYTQLSVGHS